MIRLLIVVAVLVVAVVLNKVLSKRTVQAPTQANPSMPTQVDRSDFSESEKEWLVLAFTSSISCFFLAISVSNSETVFLR